MERDNDKELIWDGFQWVTKANIVTGNMDEVIEANRRARLLFIGNVPLEYNISNEDLVNFLNDMMKEYNLSQTEGE